MIGFHVNGLGGNREGLDSYLALTRGAGLRPVICCPDDAALAVQVAQLGGTAIYRKNAWSGEPDYDLPADIAAMERWQVIEALIPPEFDEEIWLQYTIEPDKERAEWVLDFAYHLTVMANADGYRVLGPNWSTGTPEVAEWESEGGLRFLRYLGEHKDVAALGLHEYSLDAGDIRRWFPYLIGRFDFVLDVCEEHGIAFPRLIISECGWTYKAMPEPAQAMDDVAWLRDVYGEIDICLWTLGTYSQGSDLPRQLERIVDDVTAFVVETFDPHEEEPPVSETFSEWLWRVSVEYQTAQGIHVNPDTAINEAIYGESTPGLVPVTNETRDTYESRRYAYQVAQNPTDSSQRRVYYVAVPAPGQPWGQVRFIGGPQDSGQLEWSAPVGTEAERATGGIWPGAWVDANPYGTFYRFGDPPQSAYHTGADLNLNAPFPDADRGQPVHAAADGVVTFAQRVQSSTWGRLVVIRHRDGDRTVHSRYAHLATMLVSQGQSVRRGQVIGSVGGAEFGLANHLHFDISTSGELETDPTDWPGLDRARLLRDYVDPKAFLLGEVAPEPPPPEPPPAPTVDLLSYFRPVEGGNGPLFEVRFANGSQQRVQVQDAPHANRFYITKGTGGLQGRSEWEELNWGGGFIWRGLDTSPGGGRFYRQFEEGQAMARWCPRQMSIGETWMGPGHFVQFYQKADCAASSPNSGGARNVITLAARHASRTWHGVTVEDVVELSNGTERWWFARGLGMVGWQAPWGESFISELHAPGARPDNVREVIPCL